MAKVRGKNTKPEMVVRSLIHKLGYRFRLHAKELPGRPDIVFRPKKKVIFVHGCFWHRHPDPQCKLARLPKSRLQFWIPKLEANRARDQASENSLRELGWEVLTIWECELKDMAEVKQRLLEFLED